MREYSYSEAVTYFEELPHFIPPKNTGILQKEYFSLDAERVLLEKLGDPHMDLRYVHVAGTNGKGSTVAYISSILQSAGYKVGTFASPFLYKYNELLKVNGIEITDEKFGDIFAMVKPKIDELANENISPSEYEILTVMGFIYFKQMKCDIVVLEVSMGGRVDTTNVIPPAAVSVITPISYDHMSILGNTLEEIASEKAGIIKSGTKVVSASQTKGVTNVLNNKCKNVGVNIEFISSPRLISRDFKGQVFELGDVYKTSLLGNYQIDNAALAIKVCEKLKDSGYEITDEALKSGIENTKWFGRFSIVQNEPYIVVDGGHNRQGALVLRDSLEAYFPKRKIVFLMGILKDKEVDYILDTLLPITDRLYATTVESPRTLPPEELVEKVRERGGKAEVFNSHLAPSELVKEDEVLCICGSLYLIKNFCRNSDIN